MTLTLKTTATQLVHAVRNAARFATDDGTLPVLNAVRLEKVGRHAEAWGTDRYTLGLLRIDGTWSGAPRGERAGITLPLPVVRQILDLGKAWAAESSRSRRWWGPLPTDADAAPEEVLVSLTETGRLTVTHRTGEKDTMRLYLNRTEGAEYPDLREIVPASWPDEKTPRAVPRVEGRFMRCFTAVTDGRGNLTPGERGDVLTIATYGQNKPVVFTRGDWFVGAVMPIRGGADNDTAGPLEVFRAEK